MILEFRLKSFLIPMELFFFLCLYRSLVISTLPLFQSVVILALSNK